MWHAFVINTHTHIYAYQFYPWQAICHVPSDFKPVSCTSSPRARFRFLIQHNDGEQNKRFAAHKLRVNDFCCCCWICTSFVFVFAFGINTSFETPARHTCITNATRQLESATSHMHMYIHRYTLVWKCVRVSLSVCVCVARICVPIAYAKLFQSVCTNDLWWHREAKTSSQQVAGLPTA